MIKLPDVTLVAVDCTDRIQGTINSMKKCMDSIEFGSVKLLSDKRPDNLPSSIQYEACWPVRNINDFNAFMFMNLTDYIDTSHCLTVQDHAYILNPDLWDNAWLEYDWIGAPWPVKRDAYICHDTGEHVRVGNGGFSLRSKKILEIPTTRHWSLLAEQGWYNEDGNFAVYYRKNMLSLGVKYAPLDVACRFSYENPVAENYGIKPFGFHRNMPPKTWEGD